MILQGVSSDTNEETLSRSKHHLCWLVECFLEKIVRGNVGKIHSLYSCAVDQTNLQVRQAVLDKTHEDSDQRMQIDTFHTSRAYPGS